MTWAHVSYGIWAFLAVTTVVLWVGAARGWSLGRRRIRRPSLVVRAVLAHDAVRVLVLAGWLWLGWHFFAR